MRHKNDIKLYMYIKCREQLSLICDNAATSWVISYHACLAKVRHSPCSNGHETTECSSPELPAQPNGLVPSPISSHGWSPKDGLEKKHERKVIEQVISSNYQCHKMYYAT